MGFRAAVALPGHLGVELDARFLDDTSRAELAGWIALYKSLRDRLHGGRVWIGELDDGIAWQAHGDASANEILVFVYRLLPTTHRYTPSLPLTMLDATSRYRVEHVVPSGFASATPPSTAPFFEALAAGGVELAAAWLAKAGLPLPRDTAESCFIVRLQKV